MAISLPTKVNAATLTAHGISDIKIVTKIYGAMNYADHSKNAPLPYTNGTTMMYTIYIDANNIITASTGLDSSFKNAYAVVECTKTTD